MASDRRIGGPAAKNRGVLLDAAEQLMLEDGYAAVTSRRMADRAGLEAQALALKSPQPLWSLWEFGIDPASTQLTMEFMGLANHRKALRTEIACYAERFRAQQVDAISTALRCYGLETSDVPPVIWAVFATSVSRMLVMERALGMSAGHDEMLAFCEAWIHRMEGERIPATRPASA